MMFVLQAGKDRLVGMEYAYGRRPQSTIATFSWKDTAIIDTDSIDEAEQEALKAISLWAIQGFRAERWQIEGRGKSAGISREITLTEVDNDTNNLV